jgi:hypothetical protein
MAAAANPADGQYQISVVGTYSFKDAWFAPSVGNSFIVRYNALQTLSWQESVRVVVRGGIIYAEDTGPLKLEGSLNATNHQTDTAPADTEDCKYSAWPDPHTLSSHPITVAATPGVQVNAVGTSHPTLAVSASIPSQVSLQVDEHGTTTGTYRIGRFCENPKNPGTSVLLSDEDDSGGVRAGFAQETQVEFGEDADPTAEFPVRNPGKPRIFDTDTQHAYYELPVPDKDSIRENLVRSVKTVITVKRVGP